MSRSDASRPIQDPNANDGGFNSMPDAEGEGRRVYIETYGCQMNLADSELMGGILEDTGFASADSLEEADVILVNTCAVRENAEDRVFGRLSQLLQYKHDDPDVVLGVTGCMAENLREKIFEQAPYVDLVVGPDAYRRLPQLIASAVRENADPVIDVKLDTDEVYEEFSPRRQDGVGAWVTIQRGCDKFCTFCIVPFTRGRERGVPPDEVLRQCRELGEAGYKQVTLLGQTVNSYRYEETDFADLLREIAGVPGIERIRFTSPYPVDFSPKLIDTIGEYDEVCSYVHLPVQSGSNRLLDRMRRGYTVEEYRDLVERMRRTIPDLALSTDVIVGFPGETEEDFQKTVDLMEDLRFDFAYMFEYSEREKTYAARELEDDVPDEVKNERLQTIIELQESISREIFEQRVGTIQEVLVEGESKRDSGELSGRTDDFKTTVFPRPADGSVEPGDLVDVAVDDCTSHTLLGELVDRAPAAAE
ncbi:MAG: tRNA (N6-isopentenyl adenosine(37)-C2)-methylthiotransferase MiaB [Bradymonadaceae bacterium]